VFKTMCINAPIMPQTSKSRTRRKDATAEISGEGSLVAGKRRGGTLVPFLLDLACHPCERGGADRRRPAVSHYVLAQAVRPFLASIMIQELAGSGSRRG
jgi:hypothetical protein